MLQKRTTWLGLLVTVAVVATALFFTAPGSVAEHHEMAPKANHFKCYPILDWVNEEHPAVTLEDQFGKSKARVLQPSLLCNPVDKNGEGIADKENHLVCYQINDDPIGPSPRVREVQVRNQFGDNTLWIGTPGRQLCLPSQKKLVE